MDDNKNKVLRLRDVVLYTVSAMLFMDQIALASSLGPSSLFWWLYVLVLLFLPMAMMTSELGTAFPANGGVYHWVRSAFGFRWGARCHGCTGSTTHCGCLRSTPCSAACSAPSISPS
ncbi:amino acid permease [Pseudomonas aeruginosa]|uniref:amino acid permease n=1 Tax=Pseudomonas aeruginosa TaxID=287 RepID=UPI003D28C0CF